MITPTLSTALRSAQEQSNQRTTRPHTNDMGCVTCGGFLAPQRPCADCEQQVCDTLSCCVYVDAGVRCLACDFRAAVRRTLNEEREQAWAMVSVLEEELADARECARELDRKVDAKQ